LTNEDEQKEEEGRLDNKDVITIAVTVIVGLLVLLTVTNFIEAGSTNNKFFVLLQNEPLIRLVAATTVIPFLVSSLVAISFSFKEALFTRSKDFVESNNKKIEKDFVESNDKKVEKEQWKKRRAIAFLSSLKWLKAGFVYLLIVMLFFIMMASMAYSNVISLTTM